MKLLKVLLATLALSVTVISTAQARDSFNLGINIGGFGYAPPPVVYYDAPPVVYYDTPRVYYRHAPVVRYAPAINFRYFNNGRRFHRHSARHFDRGRHGWARGHHRGGRSFNRGHRGGNDRGHRGNRGRRGNDRGRR